MRALNMGEKQKQEERDTAKTVRLTYKLLGGLLMMTKSRLCVHIGDLLFQANEGRDCRAFVRQHISRSHHVKKATRILHDRRDGVGTFSTDNVQFKLALALPACLT